MSGLEVIGIVASIVQIADLGARISVQLCSVYRTVKDANDSMRSLSSDVSLTCSVLHELASALKQDSETQLCSPTAFETTTEILKECKAVFEKINDEIKRDQATEKNPILRGAQKLTLAFQGPDLDLLKSNLERLKSTMLLMLNVTMYAGQIRKRALKSTISNQRFLVEHLLEDKNNEDAKFNKLSQSTLKRAPIDEPVQGSVRSLDLEQSNGSGPSKEDHHTPKISEAKEPTRNLFRSISKERNNVANWDTPTLKSTSRQRVAIQEMTRSLDRTEHSSPTMEIEEYCSLARRLLSDIDACYNSLEHSRLLRMRNGVANLHSMETSLFQHTHGESETRCLHDPFFKCRDTHVAGPSHSRRPESASVSNTENAKFTDPDKDYHTDNSRLTYVSRISEEEQRKKTEGSTNASQSSDPGGRRKVARLLNWARAALAAKADQQIEKSGLKQDQRLTYPETPGEAYRNPYLQEQKEKYRNSPILDTRSTTTSFVDGKGPSPRANETGSANSSTESEASAAATTDQLKPRYTMLDEAAFPSLARSAINSRLDERLWPHLSSLPGPVPQIVASLDGDHSQQGVKYHLEGPIPTDIDHLPLIATNEMNKAVEDLILKWTTVTREEMEAENDKT